MRLDSHGELVDVEQSTHKLNQIVGGAQTNRANKNARIGFQNPRLLFFKKNTALNTSEFDRRAPRIPDCNFSRNNTALRNVWILSEDFQISYFP